MTTDESVEIAPQEETDRKIIRGLSVVMFGLAVLSVVVLQPENTSKYFYAVAAIMAGASMYEKPEWYT